MHFDLATVLIASLVVASVVLVLQSGDRVFAITALVASGLEALIAFRIISLSSARFRVDAILPAIIVVAGAVCWARGATKSTITAATTLVVISATQLARALHF
jgi:hypothetical protein